MLILTRMRGETIVVTRDDGRREEVTVTTLDGRHVEFKTGSGLHWLWPEDSLRANTATIKVLKVRGKQVKLGIDAPRSTMVHRHEIQQRIDAEEGV